MMSVTGKINDTELQDALKRHSDYHSVETTLAPHK